jgi:DNA polymerase III subunit epsilon
MTWLTEPLCALDTETTGTDPETASLLTCCIGLSAGVGRWLPRNWQANPGKPIPPEATKVHGITDEQASDWPGPAAVLAEIYEDLIDAADDTPIVGHNLLYDLTLLDREMRRHLGKPLPTGLIVLDTLVLFRRFDLTTGSRSLVQLASRHGITFPAHEAEADALASLRLLHILAADNDLLPHVDPQTLHHLQADWFAAQILAAHYRRLGNGQASEPPNTDWPIITNGDPA